MLNITWSEYVVEGEGKGGGGHTPREAPDSLFSMSTGHVVDLISEGEIEGLVDATPGKSVFYNETVIVPPTGTPNFKGVAFQLNRGLDDQAALTGFDNIKTSVSVAQDLPYNVPKTISFTNDRTVTAILVTLSATSFFEVNSDGDTNGSTVSFTIEKSENGGAFVGVVTGTISGKQQDTYDADYRVQITDPSGNTAIRVTRTTVDATSLKVHNSITFKLYTKIVEHKLTYPNCAVVGHTFDAKQFGNQLPSRAYRVRGIKVRIPSNYDPVQRAYNGTFNGTLAANRQYSNNPAWIFYDLITTKRYGMGQYFPEALIDIPSLYTIGKWCDDLVSDGFSLPLAATITSAAGVATVTCANHGYTTRQYVLIAGATPVAYNGPFCITVVDVNTFTYPIAGAPASPATGTITSQRREPRWACNAYMTNRGDAFNVLKDMVTCFRGVLFWMEGKLWAQADLPRDPIKIVTNSNVINGMFTYSGESNRSRKSVINISWNDPDIFYRRAIESYEDPNLIRELGWKPADHQAFGCTSRAQARRLAKAILYSQEYESELVTYKASFDHLAAEGADGPTGVGPGDLVLIADRERGNAVGNGRVTKVLSASSFETQVVYPNVTPDTWGSGTGSVYVEHIATGTVETIACTFSGTTVTLTATSLESMALGDMFIVVATGTVAEPFRVIKIAETEPNIYEITAVRYNSGKFNAIYGETQIAPSNIMRISKGSYIDPPTGLTVSESFVYNADFYGRTIELVWTAPVDKYLDGYIVSYSKDKGTWVTLPPVGGTSARMEHCRSGTYDIRVIAVNRNTIQSQPATASITLGLVPTALPAGTTANLQLQSGSGTTFVGKNAAFKWTVTSPTQTYINNIGGTAPTTGFTDPSFRDCLVTILNGATVLRTESIIDTVYTYTLEKNYDDNAGVPIRSFTIKVQYRDIYGQLSTGVSITVSNPAPSLIAPTNTFSSNILTMNFTPPTDPDFVGTIVWMSTTAGFTPSNTNRVWKATGNPSIPLTPTTTYYVRYAQYDAFGETSLNVSAEASGTSTGGFSSWSTLSGIPANLSVLTGSEDIKNSLLDLTQDTGGTGGRVRGRVISNGVGVGGFQTFNDGMQNAVLVMNPNGTLSGGGASGQATIGGLGFTGALNATYNRVNGAWVTSTAYVVGDIVTSSGSSYSCITAHTSAAGNTPPNATYWQLFAQAGVIGTNAVTASISKENLSLQAYANGTVVSFAGATGQWAVFSGATDVTASATYASAATGCTGTVNTSGAYSVTAMSASAGTLSMTATYGGVVYTKVFSLTQDVFGYEIVGTLPVATLFDGRVVYLTTDKKLYRYDGTAAAWKASVAAVDVTGQLVDTQLAALAASKVTGQLTDTQLAAIAATKITGTLADSQLAAIAAAKVTGTLADTQLAAIAAAKVTGTLADTQLAAISAAKITGQITNTQITDGSISTVKFAAASVTASVIAANTIVAGNIAAGAITTAAISAGAVTTSSIAANTIVAGNIAAGAITTAAISAGAVTTSSIAANTIVAGNIAAGTITGTQIAATTISSGNIVANTITAGNIAANTLTAATIAAGAITSAAIAANTIVAGNIAAGTITSSNIAAGTIVASNLAAGTITANELAAGAVTAAKINVTSLAAVSATIGTLRTASTGARVEISDNLIQVFDSSGVIRVKLGIF